MFYVSIFADNVSCRRYGYLGYGYGYYAGALGTGDDDVFDIFGFEIAVEASAKGLPLGFSDAGDDEDVSVLKGLCRFYQSLNVKS